MTAGFLTRLAERALGGGQQAMVRPDLPPAYAPGLLAQAPAPEFEGIGAAGTTSGADSARRAGPETGTWPAGRAGSRRRLPTPRRSRRLTRAGCPK